MCGFWSTRPDFYSKKRRRKKGNRQGSERLEARCDLRNRCLGSTMAMAAVVAVLSVAPPFAVAGPTKAEASGWLSVGDAGVSHMCAGESENLQSATYTGRQARHAGILARLGPVILRRR